MRFTPYPSEDLSDGPCETARMLPLQLASSPKCLSKPVLEDQLLKI